MLQPTSVNIQIRALDAFVCVKFDEMHKSIILIAISILLSSCFSYREEEVRFSNGDVILSGTLYLPSKTGSHPAIVFVHGDGPDTREGYRFFAELFARRGFAVLIYDKRGTGASSGSWKESRFSDLADDALAGVQLLKNRNDINPQQIGLWGGSQGGWIAPLAASRSKDVAFLIIKSGPGVGPAQLATYKSVTRVRNAGYSPEVIGQVTALMNLQFDILRSGKGWEKLEGEVQKVRNESWYRHVAVMRHSTWDSSWMNYGLDIDFDPVPIFEKLKIPVLSLLGESDVETPVEETVAILERIKKERNKDFTVKVFPGADHQIELPRQVKNRPRYAPGYLDTMINWTLERVSVNKQDASDNSMDVRAKQRLSYRVVLLP